MNAVYRSTDEAARLRWDRVFARRREELDAVPDAPAAYGRRVGRVAAGLVLCAAAAMIVFFGIAHASMNHAELQSFNPDELLLTRVLVLAWPIAALAGFTARLVAERRCRARLDEAFVPGLDLFAASDRLERESPIERLRDALRRVERASVALPLAGIALLAPLSLHLPFAGLVSRGPDLEYDRWILISGAIVGHAHLALVVCAIVFAKRVRAHGGVHFSDDLRAFGWKAWGIAILVASLPGAILFLLPTILTTVTGLVFIPATFSAVGRAALLERAWAGDRDDEPDVS